MYLELSIIGSGSKGNSIYIGSDCCRFLIDAGFSMKETARRLELIGVEISSLDAIFITHEHGDHTKGAGPISRKHKIPVYSTPTTFKTEIKNKFHESIDVTPGELIDIKGIKLNPFSVPHDARNPVGYQIEYCNKLIGIVTDLGISTSLIENRIKDLDLLIVESNHDYKMLMTGKYPWVLKQRIKSNYGHLSNNACADLIKKVYSSKLQRIYLSHISDENNTYSKAYQVVLKEMEKYLDKDRVLEILRIARQDKPSAILRLQ